MAIKTEEFDIFVNNSIYPFPGEIFQTSLAPLETIKDTCTFVLDTNALLVPYSTGVNSLEEIKKAFSKLTNQKRLVIPSQVAREFANNRPEKIKEIFQQLHRKLSDFKNLTTGHYPLLENLADYTVAINIEKEINEKLKEYKKAISNIIGNVKLWNWDDPVSNIYRDLFKSDSILDINIEKEKIKADLSYRYKHKIPPGFKDNGKEDEGIGDFLIWLTILEIGSQNKDVVFVSGDVKNDWYYKSEGQALYPRFELVTEFQAKSGNRSFHMLKLSELLKLLGVDKTVVEEVASEERVIVTKSRNRRLFVTRAERAVYYWYQTKCSSVIQIDKGAVDFIATYPDNSTVGVEVILVNEDIPPFHFTEQIKNRFYNTYYGVEEKLYDRVELVIVAHGLNYDINELINAFDAQLLGFDKSIFTLVLGYVSEDMNEFRPTIEDLKFD